MLFKSSEKENVPNQLWNLHLKKIKETIRIKKRRLYAWGFESCELNANDFLSCSINISHACLLAWLLLLLFINEDDADDDDDDEYFCNSQ